MPGGGGGGGGYSFDQEAAQKIFEQLFGGGLGGGLGGMGGGMGGGGGPRVRMFRGGNGGGGLGGLGAHCAFCDRNAYGGYVSEPEHLQRSALPAQFHMLALAGASRHDCSSTCARLKLSHCPRA